MKTRGFNLKPQYAGKSLYEALGWEDLGVDSLIVPKRLDPGSRPQPNTEVLSSKSVNGYSSIPMGDAYPGLGHHADADQIVHLASLNITAERDFNEYFNSPLSPDELSWLKREEKRFNQRTLFLRDVAKHFYGRESEL